MRDVRQHQRKDRYFTDKFEILFRLPREIDSSRMLIDGENAIIQMKVNRLVRDYTSRRHFIALSPGVASRYRRRMHWLKETRVLAPFIQMLPARFFTLFLPLVSIVVRIVPLRWGWNIAVNYRGNVECASVSLSPSLSLFSPSLTSFTRCISLSVSLTQESISPTSPLPVHSISLSFTHLLRIHRQWHGLPHSSYLHSFNATCRPWNVRANPSTRGRSVPDLRYRLSPFPFLRHCWISIKAYPWWEA